MATVPIRDILDNETGEPIFPRTHVKAVMGLADSNFFEEYIDGNGARSVKLRSDYVGLWAEGWISNGGIGGNGGGGGGSGLIDGVYTANYLGTIYSQGGTEDITKTFSAFAIDKIWQTVLGVQQSIPIVSLNNGASYSTLVINGTTADFYTKSQVDGLISGIHSFEPVPVQTLPTASADTMYKLYLVPSEDPQSQNIKDEYITYRTGSEGNYTYSWEKVGSTAIDLTGYATESWVNQQGFLKTETDPTVPAWAKASTKPSYAFSEITNTPTTVSGYGITDAVKTSGDQSISGNKTFTSTIFAHYIMEASASTPLVIGNPQNIAYIKIVEDTSMYDVTLRGIQVVDDTPYIKWEIAENGAASFASLSVGGASVTPANYVTLSGAQTISGAKTFSGGITMSGANIEPLTDSTCSLGYSSKRFSDGNIRNLHVTTFDFRDGSSPNTQVGGIYCGVDIMQLQLGSGGANGYYNFGSTTGLFHNGNGVVPCGRSDHRWSKVWSVDADLSGGLSVGGDIVPTADLGSQLGYSTRQFSNACIRDIYAQNIRFRNADNNANTGLISFSLGYMQLRTGSNIDSSFKQLIFDETNGLYPYQSGVNLGYNGANNRWATIYGVNADFTGDLSLASTSHIDIGPARIEYDATNGAIHVTTNQTGNNAPTIGFYADGFSAAGGIGTSTGTIKYVSCSSQAEYDAISPKNSSTIYTVGNPVTKIYLGTIQLYSEN